MKSRTIDFLLKGVIFKILLCLLPVVLNAQLNVSFTFNNDSTCSGTTIHFISTVTGGGSSPYLYSWNFADPPASDVANPNHVFDDVFGCNYQPFTVNLTVTDTSSGGNITDSYSSIVTVKRIPNPQLSDLINDPDFSNCDNNPTPANPDFPIQVQNNTPNSSCISTYNINWGDGSPQLTNLTNSSFPISYTYTQLGAFDLTITAFGENGCNGSHTYVVKNQSNPAIGIGGPGAGSTYGCAPQTYSFTMSNYALNSPGTTYLWDFGDNSQTILWTQDSVVANNDTITHTFLTTSCGLTNNEFIVSVTASNSCSSTPATIGGIKIWSSPLASFNVNPAEGCVNSTCFSFSNTTTPGAYGSACISTTNYHWDFGNGFTSTLEDPPCQYYSSVGTHTITLTASNPCDTTTYTLDISVQNTPTASAQIHYNNNSDCAPDTVTFTNSSTGIGIEFEWEISPQTPGSDWSFIPPTNSESPEPQIVFNDPGNYTVTLNVSNACLPPDTEVFNINVKDVPYINIPDIPDACIPYIYHGDSVSYTNNGSSITSYKWRVSPNTGVSFDPPPDSTSQFPTINFSQTGTYLITVEATNICGKGQNDISFDVIDFVQVDAGNDDTVCLYDEIQLSGIPPGEDTWSGNYVTPQGLFSPDSVGNFTLKYSRGAGSCFSADSLVMTVLALPDVDAGLDNSICVNDAPISLSGDPADGTWSGAGIVNDTFFDPSAPGVVVGLNTVIYTIFDSLTGCSNSDSKTIDVSPLPEIALSFAPPACVGDIIQFTTICNNTYNYQWSFGDLSGSNTSTLCEPTHIYTAAGLYLVSLIVNSANCESSDTTWLNVIVPPHQRTIEIDTNEGCEPLPVTISIDTSQYGDNALYFWDFGNGITSNSLIPEPQIYEGSLNGDTVYHINFSSSNSCGAFVYSESILVHPKPLSDFEMLHDWDCTPIDVQFKNNSKGMPDSYYWEFGDGPETSTEFEPVHTYTTGTSSSTYTIRLISNNGCGTDTLSQDLIVKPSTVDASFVVDKFKGCEGDTFFFQNYSTDTSISTVSWKFGDGQGYSGKDTCHSYQQAGTFSVELYVDNGCGRDYAYKTIEINPSPQINIISNDEACVGETINFEYSFDIDLAGKTWYFGDGNSSVLSNPNHIYQQEGTYDVVLTGVAAYGFPACTGVATKQIQVKPAPDAYILPVTEGCAPLQVTFQGDSGSYHLWNFGDSPAFTSNPTHVFDTPGYFKVKLISENSNMCKDADSIEIRVFPQPESGFTYTSSGGYPELLTFVNTSTGATECFWDFGNDHVLSSCEVNGPIEYNNTGNYEITLVTLNQFGCYDTAVVLHQVSYKGLFVPNAFSPEHPDPGVNLFLPKGIGLLEYTMQVFDTWGNLIWQSSALDEGMPSEGWDGKNENGDPFPQDVYVWKAFAKFSDGTNWSGDNGKTYGTVTLIR